MLTYAIAMGAIALNTTTLVHVILSLMGIASGFVVLFGAATREADGRVDGDICCNNRADQRDGLFVSLPQVSSVARHRHPVADRSGDRHRGAIHETHGGGWRKT
jgi:hypothetical protein